MAISGVLAQSNASPALTSKITGAKSQRKIADGTLVMLFIVAGLVDALEAILDALVVGVLLNAVVDLIAYVIFYIWIPRSVWQSKAWYSFLLSRVPVLPSWIGFIMAVAAYDRGQSKGWFFKFFFSPTHPK